MCRIQMILAKNEIHIIVVKPKEKSFGFYLYV